MRTQKALKNISYSLIGYVFIFIMGFINRRIFLKYFIVEYLGIESLFSNIFSILTFIELGFNSTILYSLFKDSAQDNKDNIKKLINLTRIVNIYIGIFILISGILLIPFLGFFIQLNQYDYLFIIVVYLIQLFNSSIHFFISYQRLYFIAIQEEYRNHQIDLIFNFFLQIFRLVVIIYLKDFVLYLLLYSLYILVTNLTLKNNF